MANPHTERRHAQTRDRRDIGKVVSPIEKMMAAREASSCCVGVEALLEIDAREITRTGKKKRVD